MTAPNLPARPQPKAGAAKHTPTTRDRRPPPEPCKWCKSAEKVDEPGFCYRLWACGSLIVWLGDDKAMQQQGEHRQSDKCRISQLQQEVAFLKRSLAQLHAERNKREKAKPTDDPPTDGWEVAPGGVPVQHEGS